MTNYVNLISKKYPLVQVSCAADPTVYGNILWEGGDALPTQATLDSIAVQSLMGDIWELIKDERDRQKAAGVKVGSYWFHSDDPSRIQQLALVMLGTNMPTGIMWKTMTGAFVSMTPTLASQIFQSSIGHDQTVFTQAETHRRNMMATSDPAAYNFMVNWPITYEESPEYIPN